MKQTSYSVFAFLFLFLFSTITCSQQTDLDNYLKNLMQEKEIPGMSVAIIKNGKLNYLKTFGVRANDSSVPVNDQTIFEAASLSKPVFAYAVMKWVEAGKFDLDKPLYEYLEYSLRNWFTLIVVAVTTILKKFLSI